MASRRHLLDCGATGDPGGYGAWAEKGPARAARIQAAQFCGCANSCGVHGHDHARAWSSRIPVADLKSFWGALGCACWAV